MSRLAEKLADEIAAMTIEHIDKTGDEDIVQMLATTMGDSSQTLQEAFITSIRVQRAAIRAKKDLAARARKLAEAPPDAG
ncbi:hypothetical protein [Jannaschia aquimarina]|uniref:Uncharacterized protein n=1 Tax=Jannaschia aquimarina TaxID=935700 RepID=A0A0D1EIU0_9RHOB|nr:hypothetical protein [Jannaschia aquimarina]KIT16806.1 hypothetical protein jaqu_13010 [Jannaschia aquimarina]SNT13808.1 hypothetical protein SAMN05421775_106146 [Jannaschia aquimarina]